ncbi:hypothetical protein SAMN05444955_11370 [Lihuaxuella thermophila]|uniref:Uncharacterized protein n=1 Tax=Lihuaxuella thermophila TaxID=1173111 RepID=A0A1H8H7L2_9BACL|nr:hypothetical protein SAMN05444955_11370 [Lihuaxuella thermophila]
MNWEEGILSWSANQPGSLKSKKRNLILETRFLKNIHFISYIISNLLTSCPLPVGALGGAFEKSIRLSSVTKLVGENSLGGVAWSHQVIGMTIEHTCMKH